jgi:hypothetical protein
MQKDAKYKYAFQHMIRKDIRRISAQVQRKGAKGAKDSQRGGTTAQMYKDVEKCEAWAKVSVVSNLK